MKTKLHIVIIVTISLVWLILPQVVCFAATYYVDATNGSDTNDGLTPETAWQTILEVNEQSFSPGDYILFKRGEAWREQLIPYSGDGTGYITYGAYGVGDKPLLLGSVEQNDVSNWAHEGGNIWTVVLPEPTTGELLFNPSFDTDASGWYLYPNNDAEAIGSRDTTNYDSSPAGYKIECIASGTHKNYIQFYTRNLNIIRGNYYKLTFRGKSTIGFTIDSMALTGQSSPWSRYYSSKSKDDLTITTEWKIYQVLFKASTTASDGRITFYIGKVLPEGATFYIDTLSFKGGLGDNVVDADVGNLIFNNEKSFGVKVWDETDLNEQGEFWSDEGNWILKMYSTINPASYYSDIECALTRHIILLWWGKSYINIKNLHLSYGGAHGISGAAGDTYHINISDSDFSYIGGGRQYGTVRYGNAVEFWNSAHDNVIERCRFWEIYDAPMTNQGTANGSQVYNIYYRNNIFWNCHLGVEVWLKGEDSSMHDIYIEHNTGVNAGKEWSYNQRPDKRAVLFGLMSSNASVSNIYLRNNIGYNSTEQVVKVSPVFNHDEAIIDNNCWYQSSGTMINYKYTNLYTMEEFSKYQSDTGKDEHSIATDPLFVDAADNNFHLQSTSPCIDAGVDVGLTQDFEGNPVPQGNAPDIGAYEYVLFPVSVIRNEPKEGHLPLTVTFDGSQSTSSNGDIVSYEWDFGDSSTSTGIKTSHIFTSAGEYTVTLTVTDDLGLKGKSQTHIIVFEKEFGELPAGCYNNVFNPAKGEKTLIVVELPKQAHVRLCLYNTKGNRIKELADEQKEAGAHKYYWDGKSGNGDVVGSGLYFVHIQTGDYRKTKKIVVVK